MGIGKIRIFLLNCLLNCLLVPVIPVWYNSTVLFRCGTQGPGTKDQAVSGLAAADPSPAFAAALEMLSCLGSANPEASTFSEAQARTTH